MKIRTTALTLLFSFIFSTMLIFAQTKTLESIKGESSMTYVLRHPLHHMEGVSKDIVYTMTFDGAKTIKQVTADADVTTFDSGNSNRDSHAMEVIDAISYPTVDFTSAHVTQHGDSVWAAGKLTFHGTVHDITIPGIIKTTNDETVISGDFKLSMTSYNIERPSLLGIPVDDTLKFSYVAAFKNK